MSYLKAAEKLFNSKSFKRETNKYLCHRIENNKKTHLTEKKTKAHFLLSHVHQLNSFISQHK